MKRFSKLIPAIVLLLVSAIMMSTATYAWFSMNNRVTVTGMEVKTKVSSNLLIAKWNEGDATHKGNEDANYGATMIETVKGILEPVSTVNAQNFWYTSTSNVGATGAVNSSAYIAYSSGVAASDTENYGDAFSQNYEVTKTVANAYSGIDTAVPYVEYIFFLKATNTESTAAKVALTNCDLKYNGAVLSSSAIGSSSVASEDGKAWRVAMFVQESAKDTPTAGDGTLKTILTLDGAANFTPNEAVNSDSGKGSVTYNTAAVVDNELASGATKYYKVVIRFWLEGEDTSCKNDTYAVLDDAYTLSLEFAIGTSITAATNITSADPFPTAP